MSDPNVQHKKPLLYVDVDGVISVFGFSPGSHAPGPLHEIDGMLHCIPRNTGRRLALLAEHFELVWATGWEHLANEHLPAALGLACGVLPTLTFDGGAVFGSCHWKLDAITAHSGSRPLAWVDDSIDDACRLWALSRDAPTLLVEPASNVGMTDQHVTRLCDWARLKASAESQQPTGVGRARAA